jgi:arginyl-tRNA--protein-N-Asp/Glu arginylyltransferase
MSDQLGTIIYKPCAKRCHDCQACKSFAAVLSQIDVSKTSRSERQRKQTIESRKDSRGE